MADTDSSEPARPKIWFVSDVLCAWCWGMAREIDVARSRLGDRVDFGLLLGGVNAEAVGAVPESAMRRFRRLWAEVTEVTGQEFCGELPEDFVWNSTSAGTAVAAFRLATQSHGLDYLAAMQRALFVECRDVNQREVQSELAAALGAADARFQAALDDGAAGAAVSAEFSSSGSYGTEVLPVTLIEMDGRRQLVAGGYLDAEMLEEVVTARLDRYSK